MGYYNGKPKFAFVEFIKAIIAMFKKGKEHDDWWKKNYKNHYD